MSIRQGPVPGQDAAALLALSAERDGWLQRLAAEYQAAYDVGRADGYDEGWAAAEDYAAREHQAVAAAVLETPQQSARRRLQAAEAGCRRDAADHWRHRWAELHRLSRDPAYVREANMTEPVKRSYGQIMALLLGARRSAA